MGGGHPLDHLLLPDWKTLRGDSREMHCRPQVQAPASARPAQERRRSSSQRNCSRCIQPYTSGTNYPHECYVRYTERECTSFCLGLKGNSCETVRKENHIFCVILQLKILLGKRDDEVWYLVEILIRLDIYANQSFFCVLFNFDLACISTLSSFKLAHHHK